tara:strand:- start:56013 stop:56405 length:393 start_codon:yes stop_codon:yes gene_type:complete
MTRRRRHTTAGNGLAGLRHWRGVAVLAALALWLGAVLSGFCLAPMSAAASPAAMTHLPVESAPADAADEHAVGLLCATSAACYAILSPTGQMEERQQVAANATLPLWVSFVTRRPDPPPPKACLGALPSR